MESDSLEGHRASTRKGWHQSAENVDWIVRGDETELTIQPTRDRFSDYSDGQIVRDIEFHLPDAIHACSYLRNFMTAHAFGQETQRLGPYEVYNVQQVARFLMLSICGLFNVWTGDLLEKMTPQLRRDEC